jgi:hypothetical protein
MDTVIYDMVLEAAMRAQNFNSKMLHISGSWTADCGCYVGAKSIVGELAAW